MTPLIDTETPPEGRALASTLRLEQLHQDLLDGDTADTDIAVTGIEVGDRIISAVHNTAGTLVDVTAEVVILSDGNVQLTDTDTTGDDLLLLWVDVT